MTAPNGPILFNSSTGSDTQASGLGPATAVFGTTGSSTSASAVVTGIDTTGVSAGDLFWGSTSSGRQFSIIASVDSGTQVTLDDNLAATHSGNLTWAIGGKRATLESAKRLLDDGSITGDAKGGWTIELADGHTESLSTRILTRVGGDTTNGPIIIRGETGATVKPILTFTANGEGFTLNINYVQLHDLELRNSSGTKTLSVAVTVTNGTAVGLVISGVVAADATHNWLTGVRFAGNGCRIYGCEIANCTDVGMRHQNATGAVVIERCHIHDNTSHGIEFTANNLLGCSVRHSVIESNGGDGIRHNGGNDGRNSAKIVSNIFYNNTSDGIEIVNNNAAMPDLIGNVFSQNGGYGINSAATAAQAYGQVADYNAFYSNTSGLRNGITAGANDITLTADPFTDAAGGDFTLNSTAGGGAALRAVSISL